MATAVASLAPDLRLNLPVAVAAAARGRRPHGFPNRQLLNKAPPLPLGRRAAAAAAASLGDFGARDPFPAEIASGFAEKVVGNVDSHHKILIPNLSQALSLGHQPLSPPQQPPLSPDQAQALLKKVIGWRLLDDEETLKLQCVWKLKDFKSGVELINRIYEVVEAGGHFPNLHLEQSNQVRAQLWTASIGGLSVNDFIVAAKIDEIKTADLVPKKRIWA